MRPIVLIRTGTGTSGLAILDHYISPFNIGLGVVVSGSATYTVQHTFDDVFNPSVVPVWFNHPTLTGLSANADGNYAFPVRAVRINQSAGAGTTTLTVIQAGIPR